MPPTSAKCKPIYRPRNVILLIMGAIVGLAGRHVYRSVNATPGKSVDYGQRMVDLAWTVKPGATAEDNAAPLIAEVLRRREKAREQFAERTGGLMQDADFSIINEIFDPNRPQPAAHAYETAEDFLKRQEATRLLLNLYREGGVFEAIDPLMSKSVYVREKATGRLIDWLLPDLGIMRDLARANGARMEMARVNKDPADFLNAFKQLMGMSRLMASEPVLISTLVGAAIRELAFRQLREAIMAGDLTPEMLKEVQTTLKESGPLPSIELALEGEHTFVLDTIQWTHTDDGNGNGRRILTETAKLQGSWSSTHVEPRGGSLINIASIAFPSKKKITAVTNEYFERLREDAALTAAQRASSTWNSQKFLTAQPWNYDILKTLLPAFERSLYVHDSAATQFNGMRTMVAIELYRAEHGKPPASLEALVPTYLESLLPDPYAADGKFRYRTLAAPDEHGRVYLLYSPGRNVKDDGGDHLPATTAAGVTPYPNDIVINAPK